jgi:hypothetical protein
MQNYTRQADGSRLADKTLAGIVAANHSRAARALARRWLLLLSIIPCLSISKMYKNKLSKAGLSFKRTRLLQIQLCLFARRYTILVTC